MGMSETFSNLVEEKLLNLHTAFIGKVISVESPQLCSVQPLDKIKAYGHSAKSQAVITKVPVLNHVRHYTLVKQALSVSVTDTYTGGGSATISPNPHPTPDNEGHLKVEPIKAGDLVLCVCAERDITSSSQGMSSTPPVGHHQIGNAVVIGLLGGWPHE